MRFLSGRIRFKRAVDQVRSLVVQAVGHVEVGFRDGVGLVKIDGRFRC